MYFFLKSKYAGVKMLENLLDSQLSGRGCVRLMKISQFFAFFCRATQSVLTKKLSVKKSSILEGEEV